MVRLVLILVAAGIYLVCSGCYDLFVQVGISKQPTTVSVAELEKNLPANRHLVITGGRPVTATAVTFYKTKWGTKVSGSEIVFIPIANASSAISDRSTPAILLRVTEDQVNAAKAGNKINFQSIEGIRTTSMDLEDKARNRLVETYGSAAVDKMIILDYHGSIGMAGAIGKLAGGIVIVGGLIGGFIFSRSSKKPAPQIATAAPPVIVR
jgi:hypothetical protein